MFPVIICAPCTGPTAPTTLTSRLQFLLYEQYTKQYTNQSYIVMISGLMITNPPLVQNNYSQLRLITLKQSNSSKNMIQQLKYAACLEQKVSCFGAKRTVLAQNYIQYQHISIQSTMNPSAQKKTQLKFRYQIQYTNEISDNDFFQLKSQAEGSGCANEKYAQSGQDEDRMGGDRWRGKNGRKKTGKDHPVILVQNLTSEENNVGKIVESQQSLQRCLEDKQNPKTPNKNSTPKKGSGGHNGLLLTTASKDARGSEEEQFKGKSSRKGLAWISSHILDLLEGEYRSQNRFTCGQISDKVLTDFYSTAKQKSEEAGFEEKEKKTIRRRVYDSINVLIALGKIKKSQKYLYVESIDRRIGEEIIVAKKEKLEACRSEIERKEGILNRAKREYGKLMQLKTRNEELSESKEQGYSGTFSTFSPGNSIFRFPLLLVYGEPNAKMRIEANLNMENQEERKDQIIVSSQPFLYLLSDLSCLQYLHFRSEQRARRERVRRQK